MESQQPASANQTTSTTSTTSPDLNKGLRPSFENIVSILTLITPLTLSLYFILASIFNKDIKAIIYIAGLLIGTIVAWFPLVFILRHASYPDESAYCKVINVFPFLASYNVPSYSSYFITFTAAYLIIPMIKNNDMNGWVFALMIIILGVDSIVKLKQKCTSVLGVFLGMIVGLIWSCIWVFIFLYLQPELLYFDMVNGRKEMCSMPSQKEFVCQLYDSNTRKPISSNQVPWFIANNPG